jgi:hypothetical protein
MLRLTEKGLGWFLVGVMVFGSVTFAQAAPWIGLVKTGTSSQTNDTITLGTLSFSMDLRANTDGHAVSALQFSIATAPADVVTYGTTPLTALNNPFVAADLTGLGQAPTTGSTVNNAGSNWTVWWKGSGDYSAFPEQSIGTYQFNVSSLSAGSYVFALNNQELLNNTPGEDITTFAAFGGFVLNVVAVPEPSAWTLLVCGGLVIRWRDRRRRNIC